MIWPRWRRLHVWCASAARRILLEGEEDEGDDQQDGDGEHSDGCVAGQGCGRGDKEGAQNRSRFEKIVVISYRNVEIPPF